MGMFKYLLKGKIIIIKKYYIFFYLFHLNIKNNYYIKKFNNIIF